MARLRRLNASAPQQKRIEGGEGKASRDEQDDVIYTIQWRRPKSGITNWDGDDAPLVDV